MSPALHLSVALPELTLATGAMVLLLVGVSTRKEHAEIILWAAVLALALAGFFVLQESGSFEALDEVPAGRHLALRTDRELDAILADVMALLDERVN